jgi:hypothetical protein
VGVVEAALDSQRHMLCKENFWPNPEGNPLIPTVPGIPVFGALIDEDRHEGEPVIRLNENLFGHEELGRAVEEAIRIRDYGAASVRAEVAGRAGAVLDSECVEPPTPFKTLML